MRIFWGDPPTEVLDWLRACGVSDTEAGTMVDTAIGERRREIRRTGLKSMLIGMGFLALGGGLLWVAYEPVHTLFWSEPSPAFFSKSVHDGLQIRNHLPRLQFLAFALGLTCLGIVSWGLFKFFRGLSLLTTGSVKGSLSDLSP